MRIADLLEAEGRVLRKTAARFGLSVSLFLIAAALVQLGAIGLLAGAWLGLRAELGAAWASAITGAASVLLAAVLIWIGARINR